MTILWIVGALGVNLYAQKDVSSYITNPTLSSLDGWINTNFVTPEKGNNTSGYATEAYAGWSALEITEYSLTQTITLPKGNYTLVNYSFYREGEKYNTDPSTSRAFLKAGSNEIAIKTLGSITATGYANSKVDGANVFDSKMYRNTLDFTIDSDDTQIEIGIYGTFSVIRSWCIAGMFELIDNDQEATMDSPFDVTGYITNPGFEYRDMSGWTLSEDGALGTQNNNQSFKVGGYYAEKWQASGALTERSMSQTITDVPAGYYQLTANVGGDGTYIDLNGKTVNGSSTTANLTVGYVKGENEDLTITAGKTATGSANWIHFDNFKLYFCGDINAALTTLLNKVTEYEDKLPETIYNQLSSDVAQYNTTYDDVDGYLSAISALNALYENADMSVASYAIIDSGVVPTNDVSGWAISTTNGALACNTWSTEGNSDGSGMTTPFIQDWVESGTALNGGNEGGKLYYRLNGLVPGEAYSVTALVRAYNESGSGVSGATFYAGSGQKSLDDFGAACTGNYASKGMFGTLTCAGTVDENGVFEFGIELDATSAINWLSIKDVTITESSGIVPTSIALDQSTLNLTTGNMATLTATITPENAEDKTLLWTSDNEDVATVSGGVVSAVGPGTANITVTAVAGSNVTATAAVTVNDAADIAHKSEVTGTGEYLVRNVATGLYLGAANTWGTQGSLVEHGVVLTATATDSGYTLTNIVTSTTGLGDNCYADNGSPVAFALAEVEGKENVYTLTYNGSLLTAQGASTILAINGTNASSSLAQWEFINEEDRLLNLKEGTSDAPADATYYIMDPNFSRNNGYYGNWTFEANNKNNEGDYTNYCVESYHATFSMSQELIVPNGTYLVKAQGFYRQDGSDNENLPYFFANGQTQTFPLKTGSENSMTDASNSFSAGNYYIEPIIVEVTDHVLTIGAKNESNASLWCIWDNFSLEMIDYSENQDVTLQIGDLGYASMYYGKLNLSIPENVTVSYVESISNSTLNLVNLNDVIPAGTGVILEGNAGTYSFPVLYNSDAASPENMLSGTDVETTISQDGYKYYILSADSNNNVGFYYSVAGGASVTNGAHKAYLAVAQEDQTDEVNAYIFHYTDGIQNVNTEDSNNSNVYTISGMRVNGDRLAKGLYIVDGKKIIIK